MNESRAALHKLQDEFDEYECKMDALLCRLTNGKWSKTRTYDLDFMESCVNEEYEGLYNDEFADLQSEIAKRDKGIARLKARRDELQAEREKQTADYADVIAAQIKQLRDASERNGELRTALDIAGAKLVGKPDCELCDRTTMLTEIEALKAERDRFRELASELLDAAHAMQLIADRWLA